MNIKTYQPYSCPVLISTLYPSERNIDEMKNVIRSKEEEYLKSNEDSNCYVGDKSCFDRLHTLREFGWLNNQVKILLDKFVDEYTINKNCCNFYIQKSWPVFLKNEDSGVNCHTHPNSHISFVYYLQVEEDNNTAQLNFPSRMDFWNGTVPFKTLNMAITPVQNNCVMFPSSMSHWVSQYFGETTRISITYDITITSKNIPGSSDFEMLISDPGLWRKL
jgi:uncharacterized protein (TIGR02466 family)